MGSNEKGVQLPALKTGPLWVTWPNPFSNLDGNADEETLPAVVAQWTIRPVDQQRVHDLSRPKNPREKAAPGDSASSSRRSSAESSPVRKKSPVKLQKLDKSPRPNPPAPKMAWQDGNGPEGGEEAQGEEKALPSDALPAKPAGKKSPRKPVVRNFSRATAARGVPQPGPSVGKEPLADLDVRAPVSPRLAPLSPKGKSPKTLQTKPTDGAKAPSAGSSPKATYEDEGKREQDSERVEVETKKHVVVGGEVEDEDNASSPRDNGSSSEDSEDSDASGTYFERILRYEEDMELTEKQIPSLRKSHVSIRKSVEFRRVSRQSFAAVNPNMRSWVANMIAMVAKSQKYVDSNVGYAFDVKRNTELGKMLPAFAKMSSHLQSQLLSDRNIETFTGLGSWVKQLVETAVSHVESPRHFDDDRMSVSDVSNAESWCAEDVTPEPPPENTLYDIIVQNPDRANDLAQILPSMRQTVKEVRRSVVAMRESNTILNVLHTDLAVWVHDMTQTCIRNCAKADTDMGFMYDTSRRAELERSLPSFKKSCSAAQHASHGDVSGPVREWVRRMLSTVSRTVASC